METPSSTRMVTRSQARTALSNSTHSIAVSKNGDESGKNLQTSRPKTAKQDRSVLIDITNDSPIVGLAGKSVVLEMETPSSAVSKQTRNVPKSTPGSGEALLRGQVKTLLQKVEEEAEISMFLGSTTHGRRRFHGLRGFPNSPMGLFAPTPANTPLVLGSGGEPEPVVVDLFTEYPIEGKLKISEVVSELFDGKMTETSVDSDKSLITRSLLLDFSEKSDLSTVDEDLSSSDVSDCSSVMTYESSKEKEEEEEDASIWSIQVNASTRGEDEDIETEDEVDVEEENEEFYENEDYEEEEEDGLAVDALCEGMRKMSVVGFQGKHTRFVYNNRDEIEGEEEVLHLKGVATPQGKHLRFDEEEQDV